MPRNQDGASGSQSKRRSSRLKDREAAASKALAVSQATSSSASRARRRKTLQDNAVITDERKDDRESPSSGELIQETASGTDCRRLRRRASSELDQREKRLADKEKDLNDRSHQLEERILSVERKEDQLTSLMMSQLAEREALSALKQLEDHFTCALCYEILAAPYSLRPAHCGHTFCGICVLKWFFSRLHRLCGAWHESVDCPICRSTLIPPHEDGPRFLSSFPFVPNRVTASVIESLTEKLTNPPLISQAKIKREESETSWASQSRKDRGRGCVRKREPSEEMEPEKNSDALNVAAWREGGHLRAEWLKKDREGKEEMAFLLNNWLTLESQDFVLMKDKLRV
ncbi:hypothetical protein CPC08DRAFT_664551 [Agrocybe pediades]|nr:hypothetical protein CPC08DRAFT_664551 [Agrocybe pediades]